MGFDAGGRARRISVLVILAAAMLAATTGVTGAHAAARTAGSGCAVNGTAPAPPGAPFVTRYLPHGVSLEWAPAAPGSCPIAAYQVYGTANGATALVAASTAPFASISGLATATYSFQITAVDTAHAVSAPSPSVTLAITAIPPVSDPLCVVTYALNSWPGAFTMTVTLRNEGFVTPPINGWTLTFPMGGDQQVTSASNAVVTQVGPQVTATNLASDAVIPFFGAVSIGIQGTWSADSAAPGPAVLIAKPFGRLIC